MDGYFRESVSSFAAASERLYEFSLRVQLTYYKVDIDELEAMWKSVAAQSERRRGMYIGLRTFKDGKQTDRDHTADQSISEISDGYSPRRSFRSRVARLHFTSMNLLLRHRNRIVAVGLSQRMETPDVSLETVVQANGIKRFRVSWDL